MRLSTVLIFGAALAIHAGPSAIAMKQDSHVSAANLSLQNLYQFIHQGMQQKLYGEIINIQLAAKNVDDAKARIEKAIKQFTNSTLQSGNSYMNANKRYSSLSFEVSRSKADAAAKALLDIGDLKNFSSQPSFNKASYDQLQEQMDAVGAEIDSNATNLKKMPISKSFLEAVYSGMKARKQAWDTGKDTAQVIVTLMEAD